MQKYQLILVVIEQNKILDDKIKGNNAQYARCI